MIWAKATAVRILQGFDGHENHKIFYQIPNSQENGGISKKKAEETFNIVSSLPFAVSDSLSRSYRTCDNSFSWTLPNLLQMRMQLKNHRRMV